MKNLPRWISKLTVGIACAVLAQAQTVGPTLDPPTATLLSSGLGNINGGVVLSTGNTIYFAAESMVHSRNSSGTARWQWDSHSRVFCPPSLNADGSLLYVTTDEGAIYCLNTATTSTRVRWRFPVSGTLSESVRNTPAIDPYNPAGASVYVQANDGQLYALNAATGSLRWQATTGNQGPNPATGSYFGIPYHDEPWSSSPVVDWQGHVVVATSEGRIISFDRVSGDLDKQVDLRDFLPYSVQIEAPLAVGSSGWIYGATRRFNDNGKLRQVLVALDFTQWTGSILRWNKDIPSDDRDVGSPGVIGGIVVDRMGHVFVSEFGHSFTMFDGLSGNILSHWSLGGKLCGTPSLTEDGLAILPLSDVWPDGSDNFGVIALRTCDEGDSPPLWFWQPAGTQTVNLLGSPVIRSDGRIILGDSAGRLWQLNATTQPLRAAWSTLQGGNARSGVAKPITTIIEELPAFPGGDASLNSALHLDQSGRALGLGHGTPYPYAGPVALYGAVWDVAVGIKLTSLAPGYGYNQPAIGRTQMGVYAGGTGLNRLSVWEQGIPGVPTYLLPPDSFLDYGGTPVIRGVSAFGVVAGYGMDASGLTRAVWWDKPGETWQFQVVAYDPPWNVVVNGITAEGKLYGRMQYWSTTYRGFLSSLAKPSFLTSSDFLGAANSEVLDSSQTGGSVGWKQGSTGMQAFIVPSGTKTDYVLNGLGGANSVASGVNCSGYVVGKSTLPGQTQYRAVRWTPGLPYPQDLNSSVTLAAGWFLESATGITDQGIMVGTGKRNGVNRVWRMRPQ